MSQTTESHVGSRVRETAGAARNRARRLGIDPYPPREGVLLEWGGGRSTEAALGTAVIRLDGGAEVRIDAVERLDGTPISYYPAP